jgi:UDP-2,3-diacylglucosamine hydrolase
MLSQSLEARRELAQNLRKTSRDAGSRKAADIMDVTERDVISALQDARCDTLIHGHTHRPARHENAAGTRWVLGDWDQTGWCIQLDGGALDLIEFDIKQ